MDLQAVMADVGWTLWAAIQAEISSIDFDFWGWAEERWGRARDAVFASSGLRTDGSRTPGVDGPRDLGRTLAVVRVEATPGAVEHVRSSGAACSTCGP